MRWSCPHCGISLAIADEKLSTGWSFSRCYKCGGYGLIRKAEINLIKVDKAPPGEPVILPEASEGPLLSQEATQNLARMLAKSNAMKQTSPISPLPRELQRSPHGLPDPLPDLTATPKNRSKLLSIAMIATGGVTLISGIYLYVQGQEILERTQPKSTPVRKTSLTDYPQGENQNPHEITDQVHHNAMAPNWNRSLESSPEQGSAPPQSLRIRVKVQDAKFHSGPGEGFSVVEVAKSDAEYAVMDWNDRWFKITLKNQVGNEIYGWIRNDLVHVSSAPR